MIKNRTLEFKNKYSNSESKRPPKREATPEHLQKKLSSTGFTTISETSTMQKRSSRKMAKVESTAFLKSRTRLGDLQDVPQIYSKKILQNETSLCQYFHTRKISVENPFPRRCKMPLDQSEPSQKTVNNHKELIKEEAKKSCIFIKQLPNIDAFFNTLTPRSLFFCCKCFRYIFAIQKHLHYPKCESEINLIELGAKEKQKIGWQKLSIILQLSEYTSLKFTQISNLFKSSKNKHSTEFQDVIISPNVTFLSIENIIEAFIFTKEMLLTESNYNSSGIFSMKRILACVEPKSLPSNLFEKKLFQ